MSKFVPSLLLNFVYADVNVHVNRHTSCYSLILRMFIIHISLYIGKCFARILYLNLTHEKIKRVVKFNKMKNSQALNKRCAHIYKLV